MRYERADQSASFVLNGAPSGLVGTITFELVAITPGATGLPSSSADIREIVAAAGASTYVADRVLPGVGLYQPRWHNGAVEIDDTEQLTINATGEPPPFPPGPAIPTVAEIRSESDVVWDEYGYPVPVDPLTEVDRLEAKRLDAVATLQMTTGVDPATIEPDSPWVRPLRLAIRLLTEYGVTSNTHDIADTAGDYDLISNYSVGGYSENRRTGSGNTSILHPWPVLNRLLTWIADGIGTGYGKDGPDQSFADDSELPPGWRQMERLFGGPGVSPPGPFQPSLADLYRGW